MGQHIIKALGELKTVIENRKFLLVRDSAYEYLEVKSFFDDIPHAEFTDFTPNPLYEQVCKGIEVFKREKCELIIAVGGGSTIDVAKCIKLYCKMRIDLNYLKQEPFDSGIMLIAMPTTAGTGSESTCHAVIYYDGLKQSVSHTSIIPDYAVLEPTVLKTLPLYQKKCTMLDALCQAIESWWSVNSTDESKVYSKAAIKGIKENWKEYIEENKEEAAEKIMEAANFAGRAINITATTAAHAMSYKITSLYNLPHGHAVAICMPEVWEYILGHVEECIDGRGIGYLKNTLKEISLMVNLEWFCALIKRLDMGNPQALDRKAELEILAQSVNLVRLKNNPVEIGIEALKDMYGRIIK